MKKLLNVLMVLVFTGSSLTVVACGAVDDKNKIKKLTNTQQEMVDGAEFISRLIIAARHENLNYNVNEILSMYLTPKATAMNMPVKYNVDGTSINLSTNLLKYKNLLAPNINKFDMDNYAGFFASYVMGMYENDFYDSIINGDENGNYYFEDSFSQKGSTGYNKKKDNALGYAHGLSKNLELSGNEDRRNLAWAIQDTGALTNYLLYNGFDGGFVGDTNATGSPATAATVNKGGTNGGSYLFYNSLLGQGQATCNALDGNSVFGCRSNTYKVEKKLNEEKLKYDKRNETSGPKIEGPDGEMYEFNNTGIAWTQEAGDQNVTGFVSMFSSLIDNVSETVNGSNVLLQLINYLFPFKNSGSTSESAVQGIGEALSLKAWDSIKNIKSGLFADDTKLMEMINKLDKAPELSLGLSNTIPTNDAFYKSTGQDKINVGTNAALIVDIIEELLNIYDNTNDKQDFINKLFIDPKAPFKEGYKLIIEGVSAIVINIKGLGEDVWDATMSENQGGRNWLELMKSVYKMFSDAQLIKKFDDLETMVKDMKFESVNSLSYTEKNKLIKELGFVNNKYQEGSIMKNIFDSISNLETPGQKELRLLLEGFMTNANESLNPLHENVIQYVTDDKYWKKSKVKLNTTDNKQPNGVMEFELNYVGVGDQTSNASTQFKKVDVPLNFNPYQVDYSKYDQLYGNKTFTAEDKIDKTKISGKVLGMDENTSVEDLWNYDGLGNYEDYEEVNFKYKLRWENISKNPNSPYWVMTSLKSYDSQGNEFYNLY